MITMKRQIIDQLKEGIENLNESQKIYKLQIQKETRKKVRNKLVVQKLFEEGMLTGIGIALTKIDMIQETELEKGLFLRSIKRIFKKRVLNKGAVTTITPGSVPKPSQKKKEPVLSSDNKKGISKHPGGKDE